MVARELVGHTAARAVLLDAVDALLDGRGGLVLVSGEPGIGKTWVVSHATTEAADRGFGLLWATCWDGPGAPAYWPWVQVIRSHVRACDPELLRAQLGTGTSEVARLVDDVAVIVDAGEVRVHAYAAVFVCDVDHLEIGATALYSCRLVLREGRRQFAVFTIGMDGYLGAAPHR